jgi:hypothetical protein
MNLRKTSGQFEDYQGLTYIEIFERTNRKILLARRFFRGTITPLLLGSSLQPGAGKRLLALLRSRLHHLCTQAQLTRSDTTQMQLEASMNLRIGTALGLFAMYTGMAFGQATNSADVTGTVTDTTGAVIPGVKVVVKDLNQGTERDITSNGAGLYDSGPIVANDRFTITFSREGFGSDHAAGGSEHGSAFARDNKR